MSSGAVCVACGHSIDASARLCPYCGANPATGEKIDTESILREEFKGRNLSTSQSVMKYARHRQGVVIAVGLALVFLTMAGLHQWATMRNETAVANGPAVPLSDVADLSDQRQENQQTPMPPLNFEFNGNPQTMRTFILEPGAVAPAPNGAPPSAGLKPSASGAPASAGPNAPPAKAGAPPAKAGAPLAKAGAPPH
jgi:hypothetical protein